MKKTTGILLLALPLLFHCGGEEKNGGRTRVFKDYLKERFDRSLPEEKARFLIIPHGCQGAIGKSLMDLDRELLRKADVQVIASNEEVLSYWDLPEEEVLLDSEGELDRLSLPFHNLSLVTTEDGELQKILSDKHCSGEMGERIERMLKSGN